MKGIRTNGLVSRRYTGSHKFISHWDLVASLAFCNPSAAWLFTGASELDALGVLLSAGVAVEAIAAVASSKSGAVEDPVLMVFQVVAPLRCLLPPAVSAGSSDAQGRFLVSTEIHTREGLGGKLHNRCERHTVLYCPLTRVHFQQIKADSQGQADRRQRLRVVSADQIHAQPKRLQNL